jgi:hypothetical protein
MLETSAAPPAKITSPPKAFGGRSTWPRLIVLVAGFREKFHPATRPRTHPDRILIKHENDRKCFLATG